MYSTDRRTLLTGGLGLGALTLLAGCGATADMPAQAGSTAGREAVKGGVLRVGAIGSRAKLQRDPHQLLANDSDFLIMSLVYDAMTVPGRDHSVAPRLAASWESSPDVRQWRFTIAKTAKFHDGTPVTAQDVVWSLRRLSNDPANSFKVPVPANAIIAKSDRIVQLTTSAPNSQLPLLLRLMTFVMKDGTSDPRGFLGTGPFRLDSYSNGNARLVRNPDWHGGTPHLDAIEVTMFESTDAMSNAVLAGQIDLASNVGPIAARTAAGRASLQVVRRPNDGALPIVMRTSDGPFADPRIREALRLAADRDQLVAQALSGYGTVANDILGTGDKLYDATLPQRRTDRARANQLLDEVGFDRSRRYELFTVDEAFGQVESAKLFARQVAQLGVQIEVIPQDGNVFYEKTWCKADLYNMYWGTNDSIVFFASKVLNSASKANETAFADPEFDAAYGRALAAATPHQLAAAVRELQHIQHARSGYLLWGMADGIDVASASVRGLPTLAGYGRVQLENAWLAG